MCVPAIDYDQALLRQKLDLIRNGRPVDHTMVANAFYEILKKEWGDETMAKVEMNENWDDKFISFVETCLGILARDGYPTVLTESDNANIIPFRS